MRARETIQQYLYEHIPISRAMVVRVEKADNDRVVLTAPLEPNINHRETVFGGSASSVAILAAWTLVHFRLQTEGFMKYRVVIQRNTMDYEKPVPGDFKAICTMTGDEKWQRFIRTLARKNRSRIILSSYLEYEGKRVGIMEGTFVAINLS